MRILLQAIASCSSCSHSGSRAAVARPDPDDGGWSSSTRSIRAPAMTAPRAWHPAPAATSMICASKPMARWTRRIPTVGLARLHMSGMTDPLDAMLFRIQNDLFDLGADLSTPDTGENLEYEPLRIIEAQATRLESEIDALNADLDPLRSFILPGGSAASAYLHLARTVSRRAERLMVELLAPGNRRSCGAEIYQPRSPISCSWRRASPMTRRQGGRALGSWKNVTGSSAQSLSRGLRWRGSPASQCSSRCMTPSSSNISASSM